MNRMGMTLFYVLISYPLLFGSEVTITKVLTFPNDQKTSVVIYYEGIPELAFYAVDTDENVLSLDLPGVYSEFDFSSLALAQVEEIRQMPLDPDESSGISVRFFLKPHTEYQIYNNGSGTLTLLFETKQTTPAVEPMLVQDLPATHERVTTPAPLLQGSEETYVLGGSPGENRLSRLSVWPIAEAGLISLTVDNLEDYRYFSLEAPKRFVLDLRETLFSLTADQIALDLPLVQRIRARQFQSHPSPITRIVMDLKDETNVSVHQVEGGIMIAFATDSERLAALLDTTPNTGIMQAATEETPSAASEQTTVADSAVADPAPRETETIAEKQPQALEEDLPVPVDPIVTTNAATAPAELPLQVEEVTTDDTLQLAAHLEEPVVQSVPEDTQPVSLTERLEVYSEANLEAEQRATAEAQQQVLSTEELTVAALEDSVPTNEVALPDDHPEEEASSEQVAVSEPATLETLTATEDPASVQTGITPMQPEVIDSVEIIDAPKPQPAPESFIVDKPAAEENLFAEKAIQEKQAPGFVMASDVDMEMAEFLADEDDSTLYDMMKGTKSTRGNIGRVVVTNTAIDANRRLAEMKPMQEESDVEEDPATLFREDDQYASLGDEEKQYRGFEIAIIDVRDQPVVDLLRFIADQVGINLYVDPEVGDIRATYSFRSMPWDQVLDIILSNAGLDKEFRNGVLRIATTRKFEAEEKARASLRQQRELSVPTETVYKSLNYADAADVMPLVQEYLSPRGTILMDERTNTLIIADIPQKIIEVRTLINRLDQMISQVTIEARIVETTTRFLRELGIQWGLTAQYTPELGTDTGLRFPNRVNLGGPSVDQPRTVNSPGGGYAVNFPIVAENPSGFGLTLGNFLDNFKLDVSLQLLEQEGQGQIISSPKITTQNNRTALIRNGQRIPIQTIQRGTVTTKFVDAVLELQVTPHITADETVIMDLVVDKSEPDFTRAAGAGGNPIINVSRAETQVLVKNGGTAVIGGIFALNEQTTENGLPKLRKIPFLKRLFGSEQKQYSNQELLIFVTPRIVKY